ncbi:hypothetical protein BLOT_016340 [Blomia tropicalis]|nr:hypothetical protein BLOT_016340 [Blomia tropicalis]
MYARPKQHRKKVASNFLYLHKDVTKYGYRYYKYMHQGFGFENSDDHDEDDDNDKDDYPQNTCDKAMSSIYEITIIVIILMMTFGWCKTETSTINTNQLEDIVCNNETLEAPICASNGQVFETECQMKRTNLSLTKSDWEVCRGLHPLCPEDCLDIQDPVCAEDGKVHPNKCVMHRRNCGRRISERPMIFCLGSHRKSRTQNQCPDSCLELHQPVCGSDGQIYLNECYLRMMNCKNGVEKMKMEMCVTPPRFNKKVYINQCTMLKAECKRPVRNMPLQFCVGDNVDKL